MFRPQNEKTVQSLFLEHIQQVEESISHAEDTLKHYLAGESKEAREASYRVHLSEGAADGLRRKIIASICRGAFMPAVGKDLISYLARQDKIADRAESTCDFIVTQTPEVPEGCCRDIVRIIEKTSCTLKPLEEALGYFFTDFSKIREPIKRVNTIEEEIDHLLRDISVRIFADKSEDLARQLHFHELVFHLSSISDVIEEAADMLDSMVVKKKI